jgi:hypothetical protein
MDKSTNDDTIEATAKRIAFDLIAPLRCNGEPIQFDPIHRFELLVLVAGGVTPLDFRVATEVWASTTRKINGPDWGYIKSVALRRAAQRKMLVKEASNG